MKDYRSGALKMESPFAEERRSSEASLIINQIKPQRP
jgi:hypothetical protein